MYCGRDRSIRPPRDQGYSDGLPYSDDACRPLFAESNAERRGKLLGLFLASVCILIAGVVLVRRKRNKSSRQDEQTAPADGRAAHKKTQRFRWVFKRRGRDSNPRYMDLQSIALATWLPRRA